MKTQVQIKREIESLKANIDGKKAKLAKLRIERRMAAVAEKENRIEASGGKPMECEIWVLEVNCGGMWRPALGVAGLSPAICFQRAVSAIRDHQSAGAEWRNYRIMNYAAVRARRIPTYTITEKHIAGR